MSNESATATDDDGLVAWNVQQTKLCKIPLASRLGKKAFIGVLRDMRVTVARTRGRKNSKTRVVAVAGDGRCIYGAVSLALKTRPELGLSDLPSTPETMKQVVIAGLLAYVLGDEEGSGVLSQGQYDRAKYADCTIGKNHGNGDYLHDDPRAEDRDQDWLSEATKTKVLNSWGHLSWLSFVAVKYAINIAVWEPTGNSSEIQLYQGMMTPPLFVGARTTSTARWVHIIYRSVGLNDSGHWVRSWSPRIGVQQGGRGGQRAHNHFDLLALGPEDNASFLDALPQASLCISHFSELFWGYSIFSNCFGVPVYI